MFGGNRHGGSFRTSRSSIDPNKDDDGFSEIVDSSSSSSSSDENDDTSDGDGDEDKAKNGDLENGQLPAEKNDTRKQNGKRCGLLDDKPVVNLSGLDLMRTEFSKKHFFSLETRSPISIHNHRRFVTKKGLVRVENSHVAKRGRRYIADFFNTMLDIKWRYVLLIFTMSFFASWLGFAALWYAIAYIRGDLEEDHLPDKQEENHWQPCVLAIHNFASAFLFSVETQHTIGYGTRQTTERCPEAIFLESLQSVVGTIIQACLVGTFFAKLSRPKKRAQTLLFTKNAVVCTRDGNLCLLFRVGNMRHSQLVESHVRAILVSKKITEEGEIIPYSPTELKVGVDIEGEVDNILFLWPATVIHKIDDESPFYHLNAQEMLRKRFEIIVTLEGIVEPSGMSVQARSSFMPDEILWGYRFVNVLRYNDSSGQYNIDYDCFNSVYKIDISTDSAKQIAEEKKKKKALEKKQKRKSKKTEQNKRKAKTDDESDARGVGKTKNAPLLGGSSPSLMMAPQAFPVYYAPYPYPRNIGQAPTLSTPLLWPPQPPMANYSNSSPVPARYTHRRRMTNHDSSSPVPCSNSGQSTIVKSDREATPERQYWIV